MAKTPILKPEEIELDTLWRGQIAKWEIYQKELDKENSRWFIKIAVKNPTETIQFETMYVRGVWWEIIRFSGAGRRKGWIVAGDNQPLSITALALFLNTGAAELLKAIRRLSETKRLLCYSSSAESDVAVISTYPEISSDMPDNPDLRNKKEIEKEIEKEKKRKENEAARQKARLVFDYYLSKELKQYRVFSTWEPKIKTRLKKYSVDDLKLCIDNIAASEWHRDNGQHGLQQIVDSDKRIEKWLVWEKPKANSTGQQSNRPSNLYVEGNGNNYADRKPDAEG